MKTNSIKKFWILGFAIALIVIGVILNFTYGNMGSAGEFAANYFSIGIFSSGVFSMGIFSIGIFSMGIFSIGIFSLGIFNIALYAVGFFLLARKKEYPDFIQKILDTKND